MSGAIETSVGPMTSTGVVDYLTYCSYKHNREAMSAAQLATIFPQGAALEQRYQDDLNAYVDRGVKQDQAARHEGRPEHDMDVFGRHLKAGT